jgi:hypothetical protein
MFGGIMLLPLYMQIVHGASPTESGLLMLPMVVGMMAASIGSGQVISRTGHIRLFPIIGSGIMVAGLLLLSFCGADTALVWVSASMFVLGIGLGNCMQPLLLIIQSAVPPTEIGVATSSATFFRQIGGTLGVAVFGTLVTNSLQDSLERELGPDLIAQTPPNLLPTLEEPRTLLNPDSLDRLEAGFLGVGPQGAELYGRAVEAMRIALSDALGLVFIVSTVVTAIALAVSFLMPEPSHPLRRSWAEPEEGREPARAGRESGRFEGEPIS